MYQYIHKYFALHKNVSLPGIGSFTVENQNAKLDFIGKTLHAPSHNIRYNKYDKADESFYRFLSKETGVDETDAYGNFNNFIQQLKTQLERDHVVILAGIGTLTKNTLGYSFIADETLQRYFSDVHAERVIREDAQHKVIVGERERTSAEMHEHFQKREVKEEKWMIPALILGAIGVAAIVIFYLIRS
jgi:nucleoid DNA-binding protein